MSGNAPIFVVFGGSGSQGSAVATAILRRHPHARVRTVTRSATGKGAVEKGKLYAGFPNWAGWTEADADKAETLSAACDGADAVWFVTNFWEHMDGAREEKQGRAIIDAAAAAGVKTIIYSGLDSPRKRFDVDRVHHFEHKYAVERYLFESSTAARVPNRISQRMSYYMENLLTPASYKKTAQGILLLCPMGGKRMKMATLADYGEAVAEILIEPHKYHLRTLNMVSDFLTVTQMAEAVSKATGVAVTAHEPTTAEFAAFGFPGADDLAQMFLFYQMCGPGLEADDAPIIGKHKITTLQAWADSHAEELRAQLQAL